MCNWNKSFKSFKSFFIWVQSSLKSLSRAVRPYRKVWPCLNEVWWRETIFPLVRSSRTFEISTRKLYQMYPEYNFYIHDLSKYDDICSILTNKTQISHSKLKVDWACREPTCFVLGGVTVFWQLSQLYLVERMMLLVTV